MELQGDGVNNDQYIKNDSGYHLAEEGEARNVISGEMSKENYQNDNNDEIEANKLFTNNSKNQENDRDDGADEDKAVFDTEVIGNFKKSDRDAKEEEFDDSDLFENDEKREIYIELMLMISILILLVLSLIFCNLFDKKFYSNFGEFY
ncbi:MAG: hypothetical protein MHPSP_001877 [Paramarteilia canceri]